MSAVNLDLDLDLSTEPKTPQQPSPQTKPIQPKPASAPATKQVTPAPAKVEDKPQPEKSEVVLTTSDQRNKQKEQTNSRLIAKQRYIPSKVGLILSIIAVVLSLAGICVGLFLFLKK